MYFWNQVLSIIKMFANCDNKVQKIKTQSGF